MKAVMSVYEGVREAKDGLDWIRIMDTKFNVFEILEIAEKVEQRGAKFYLGAAQLFAQEDLKNCYYGLAERKVKLKNMWTNMRQDFSNRTGEFGTYDPENYVLSNPEVMASLTWAGSRLGAFPSPDRQGEQGRGSPGCPAT